MSYRSQNILTVVAIIVIFILSSLPVAR